MTKIMGCPTGINLMAEMAVHYSSITDNWSTPQAFYDQLDKEFNFTLDPCADKDNAKCDRFFTKDDDGLMQRWEGSVFMNPPYGREIGKWIKKAYEEAGEGALVVCLIPARTDTSYWHDYCMKGEIRFVRGRIQFGDSGNNAPFPSAVVIFRPHNKPIQTNIFKSIKGERHDRTKEGSDGR